MVVTMVTTFCFSFGITFCLIPFLRKIAFKAGILDIPHGALKKHEKPTPYLGGLGLFVGFIAAIFIVHPGGFNPSFFFAGLCILILVGLVDDLYPTTPLKKFSGQLIACIFFLKAGLLFNKNVFLKIVPFFLQIPGVITGLNVLFSVWWMLSLMNAFNLIDVMDGLTTVVALTVAGSFLAWALILKNYLVAVWLSALIGALLAFFWYNKPRASIYLGDTGSLFLGGCFSVIPFFLDWGSSCRGDLLIPVLILIVPIFELCALIVIRKKKGLPVYYGSPHHFICYLKARDYSVKQILGLTFLGGASFGIFGLLVAFFDIAPLGVVVYCAPFVCLSIYFVYFREKTSSFS